MKKLNNLVPNENMFEDFTYFLNKLKICKNNKSLVRTSKQCKAMLNSIIAFVKERNKKLK